MIKVVAGFYLGCTGYLMSPHNLYINQFQVKLFCEYKKNGFPEKDELDVVLESKDFEVLSRPR